MVNSARKWISLLLIIILIAGCVPLNALGADDDEPHIPIGEDISEYKPGQDGYFGYIEARNEAAHNPEARIPVLVWKNAVLADLSALTGIIPGLSVFHDGDAVMVRALNRQMVIISKRRDARFVIGSEYANDRSLIDEMITLSAMPIYYKGKFWVPLTDVLTLMNVPWCFEETYATESGFLLRLQNPQRLLIDVLAEYYDPVKRSGVVYELPVLYDENKTEEENEAANKEWWDHIKWKMLGAKITLSTEAFNHLSVDYVEVLGNVNIKAFIDDILEMDEDEFAQSLLLGGDIFGVVYSMEGDILEEAGKLTGVGSVMASALTIPFDFIAMKINEKSLQNAFSQRDRLAADALQTLPESPYLKLNDALQEYTNLTVENYRSAEAYSSYGNLRDKASGLIKDLTELTFKVSGAKGVVGIFAGALGAVGTGFTLAAYVEDLAFKYQPQLKKIHDEMEALVCSICYGFSFQEETEARLGQRMDELKSAHCSPASMENAMKALYLHLKTCALTRQLFMEGAGIAETGWDRKITEECNRDMAILSASYSQDAIRQQQPDYLLQSVTDTSLLIGMETPLYMTVSGKVLEEETDRPVQDAHMEFSVEEEECGFFDGTPEGRYDEVYVPIPVSLAFTVKPREAELVGKATSPTIEGEDEIRNAFVPKDPQELETAYLGDATVKRFYEYLKKNVVPRIGVYHGDIAWNLMRYTGTSSERAAWNDFLAGASGLVSAAVCDFNGDGRLEMVTVTGQKMKKNVYDDDYTSYAFSYDLQLYGTDPQTKQVVQWDEIHNVAEAGTIGNHAIAQVCLQQSEDRIFILCDTDAYDDGAETLFFNNHTILAVEDQHFSDVFRSEGSANGTWYTRLTDHKTIVSGNSGISLHTIANDDETLLCRMDTRDDEYARQFERTHAYEYQQDPEKAKRYQPIMVDIGRYEEEDRISLEQAGNLIREVEEKVGALTHFKTSLREGVITTEYCLDNNCMLEIRTDAASGRIVTVCGHEDGVYPLNDFTGSNTRRFIGQEASRELQMLYYCVVRSETLSLPETDVQKLCAFPLRGTEYVGDDEENEIWYGFDEMHSGTEAEKARVNYVRKVATAAAEWLSSYFELTLEP